MTAVDDVREFEEVFLEYRALLDEIGERLGGEHWFSAATAEERKRVGELRHQLNRLYGRVRAAMAEANGGIPVLGNAYTTAGEVPQVALADPSDNPWIEAALDGTQQLIAMTMGTLERAAPMSRTGDEPQEWSGRPTIRATGRANLKAFALSTTQQVVGGVLSALAVAALAAALLTQCGLDIVP